jgi:serine protease
MGAQWSRGAALGAVVGAVFVFAPIRPDHPGQLDPTGVVPTPQAATQATGPGLIVVDLDDGASDADLAAASLVAGVELAWVHPLAVDEGLAQGWVPDRRAAVEALRAARGVELAEAELTMSAFAAPNDPMLGVQWNLPAIGLEAAWADGVRGDGVIVAVVDTGVSKVEDLALTNVLAGASFVPGVATADDDQGHGTHVAGTIAQSTDNGVGVAGVSPGATILPVKVLSAQGFGSSAWIAAGIDFAADEGAQVINLSLGGGYSEVIHNAIKKARERGVIVVAAAGNSGTEGVGYPGALDEVIGVSAFGPDGQLAPYSSWGRGVDISAPGGDKRKVNGGILQNTVDGRGGHHYAEYQGTSMATPHVAGAAALLLGQGLAPDAVERVLLQEAQGDGFNLQFGHGRLDVASALGRVQDGFGRSRFLLGAVITLLVSQLARTRGPYVLVSSLIGAWVAGGLFFLPSSWLGASAFVTRPGLEWPAEFVGGWLVTFPLWLSVAATAAVAFTLGAFRAPRPLAQGLAGGTAAYLFHAAATGAVEPAWLPGSMAGFWLGGHATLCVLVAMALAGAQRLDEEERA